jgi:hypothetical protein
MKLDDPDRSPDMGGGRDTGDLKEEGGNLFRRRGGILLHNGKRSAEILLHNRKQMEDVPASKALSGVAEQA